MKRLIFIAYLVIITTTATPAQMFWTFELHGGEVYNMPMNLLIKQHGYPDIKLTASYHSEALILPVYWDWRVSRWENGKSWEFEAIHHKLYLVNTTPEVQKFNVSHGFNMIFLNRGFDKKSFRYRAGAGIVLAHPESNIRGKEFGDSTGEWNEGYSITGPVFNFAIGKPIPLNNCFHINAEAKTTFAYSHIKIAQGHANVYNLAFHLVLGVGFNLAKSEKFN